MAVMPDHVADYGRTGMPPPAADGRLDSAAFHRNHAPIWSALSRFLGGRSGDVLEIGSGTGQHAVAFARQVGQRRQLGRLDAVLRIVDVVADHDRLGGSGEGEQQQRRQSHHVAQSGGMGRTA
jgi:hypothetical protein